LFLKRKLLINECGVENFNYKEKKVKIVKIKIKIKIAIKKIK